MGTSHHPRAVRADVAVRHRHMTIDGVGIFYREAGPADAPVLLLPHGYPASSIQFRRFMPALADRWRLLAPDFPGFGYSDTPEGFAYTFGGYAELLHRFVDAQGAGRFGVYLHDYGSQIGLRLAMRMPQRIAALIIQNGDIYEDELGPKYQALRAYWDDPTPERREPLVRAVSEDGFRDEFLNEVDDSSRRADQPGSLAPVLVPDGHAQAARDRARADGGVARESGVVSALPGLSARTPTADPDRLGSAGRLHAGGRRACLSPRPAGCRAAPAEGRALGARDQSRRDRRPIRDFLSRVHAS